MKTLDELVHILNANLPHLKKAFRIREIGIFGSYVREAHQPSSDVDILVEFEEAPDLLKFIELEMHLERLLGVKVDLVRKSSVRSELKQHILNEVIMI